MQVLRQLLIAADFGPRRPKGSRTKKPKAGTEGEDIVQGEHPCENEVIGYGGIRLCLPPRFKPGSMKAAVWHALTDVGPEGMHVTEVTERVKMGGLRDLATSKTPEASVAGALGKDVVFARIAPARYALHAIVAETRYGICI